MTVAEGPRRGTRVAAIFGLDLRSLALFRVALALSALADLAIRSSDLVAHYTDGGIASRRDVLEEFAFLHDRAFSLHMIGGSAAIQSVLFAAAAAAAVAMLVGYRTRVATPVLWLLTMSVQLRNLYVGAGYDAMLRMLLLWSCFLPLGARASIDAARDGRADASRPYLSVASVGLIVQLSLVFFVAGYGKWVEPVWQNGTALAAILADDMRVTGIGMTLRGHTDLLAALTPVIAWFEMLAPLLFFSPILAGPLRTAAALGLAAMAAGFGIALHVGLFPAITAAGVFALLPSWFWDVPWRRLRAMLRRRPVPAASRFLAPRPGLVREGASAILLAFVIVWNLGPVVLPGAATPGTLEWIGSTFFLQQGWGMFAQPATRTGWLVMPGELVDGRSIDLLAAGGRVPDLNEALRPISWTSPALPSEQYANDRWRNFLHRAVRGTDTAKRLNFYGRFLCREWNRAHGGGEQLSTFELWWVAAEIEPGPRVGPYQRRLIWSHGCFS